VILVDRDLTNGWTGGADGTREKRYYPIQNWRADVVAVTEGTGIRMESVRYSPYGIPATLSDADYDQDGDVDSADETAFNTDYGGGTNLKADLDWDGTIDGQDDTVFDLLKADADGSSIYKAPGDSRGTLSIYGLRKGYAGYENDGIIVKLAHVRNRVLDHETGRWTRRDPWGYVDGISLVAYTQAHSPVGMSDPLGLQESICKKTWGLYLGVSETVQLGTLPLFGGVDVQFRGLVTRSLECPYELGPVMAVPGQPACRPAFWEFFGDFYTKFSLGFGYAFGGEAAGLHLSGWVGVRMFVEGSFAAATSTQSGCGTEEAKWCFRFNVAGGVEGGGEATVQWNTFWGNNNWRVGVVVYGQVNVTGGVCLTCDLNINAQHPTPTCKLSFKKEFDIYVSIGVRVCAGIIGCFDFPIYDSRDGRPQPPR
jgi:RHS repeat-associated protein